MNRRRFLVSAGAAGLAAATGATAFALTRSPVGALAPWAEAAGATSDLRLFVVRHAVLAPNPHNRQPWIVELTGPQTMTLWCDLERRLPQTDPYDRQILIGLGCFIELAAVAASALGQRLEVAPFPSGEPGERLDRRPIAHLTLSPAPDLALDPLFAQIPHRRSTKRPFDMARPVPAAAISALQGQSTALARIATVTDPALVAALRDLTWEAWRIEAATPRTLGESVELMRIGRREIEANPDGIALGGPFLEGLALVGQLSRERLGDPASAASRQGFDMYQAMLAAAPSYLTVVAPDGSRSATLAAGRAYLRANLLATALGLSLHPVSQALQEFPEMDMTRGRLDKLLDTQAPKRLHMLARLGYGPSTPQTPRWAASTRIRTS